MTRIASFARTSTVAVVLAVVGHGAASAQGLPGTTLYATGSSVWVKFIGSDAGFLSDVYFLPFIGSQSSELPTRHRFSRGGSDLQFASSSVAPQGSEYLFRNRQEFSLAAAERQLDFTFAQYQEVIFGLYVHDTGHWYYSGDPTRNSDGVGHVELTRLEDGRYRLGFEDLPGGGDRDYNDMVIEVGGVSTVTPEPLSMLLLGSGLAGIGGVGRLRRRRKPIA